MRLNPFRWRKSPKIPHSILRESIESNVSWKKQENRTVYKIVYSGVRVKPEMQFILLKRLVGERGFEPPTPWSRTRCSTRLSHSPTDGWMTATTGTTWRHELNQYSILRLVIYARGLHSAVGDRR